jgi:hypothetical protein
VDHASTQFSSRDATSPGVPRGVSHDHDESAPDHDHVSSHENHADEAHAHGDHAHGDHAHGDHVHVEATPPTVPSRAVVINVHDHAGALVLASNEERSGIEVEIHPVSHPEARTHVWVLPREGRDGVVYAAIFPSLECGDYAILNTDGSIGEVISIPPNRVTHTTWS